MSVDLRDLANVVNSWVRTLLGPRFSAECDRDPARRETEVTVRFAPAVHYHRIRISDSLVEDAETAGMLHRCVEDGVAILRGDAIAAICQSGRSVRFRQLNRPGASALVYGMLGALDSCGGLDDAAAAKRLAAVVLKHADSATCERLALELMSRVERIGR